MTNELTKCGQCTRSNCYGCANFIPPAKKLVVKRSEKSKLETFRFYFEHLVGGLAAALMVLWIIIVI